MINDMSSIDSESFSESESEDAQIPLVENLEVINENPAEEKDDNEKKSEQISSRRVSNELKKSGVLSKKSIEISENSNLIMGQNLMFLDPLNIQSLKKERKKSYFTPKTLHAPVFHRKSYQMTVISSLPPHVIKKYFILIRVNPMIMLLTPSQLTIYPPLTKVWHEPMI